MKKLIPIILLFFAVSIFAQEQPKAELVDEFGKVTCEDLSARINNLQIQMSNNPDKTGFVVFKRGQNPVSKIHWYRKFLVSSFELRNISMNGLKVVMDEFGDSAGGSFWLLPPGSVEPISHYSKLEDEKIDKTKPFVFDYEDELGICPTFVPRLYTDLLKENPKARGHIVVSGGTADERRWFVKSWLETFSKDFQMPANRFRIFYVKARSKGIAGAEFWFVPHKSK